MNVKPEGDPIWKVTAEWVADKLALLVQHWERMVDADRKVVVSDLSKALDPETNPKLRELPREVRR